jgi:hypothetical protein
LRRERKRKKKRADDNGKSRKSVGCGSDPIGRRRKKEKKGLEPIRSLGIFFFRIEGSRRRRRRRRRGGEGLDS